MSGVVHVPWYATGFRAEPFAEALAEVAAISLRYGATDYRVYQHRDDRYRFIQTATFEDKLEWARYWDGPEFIAFRTDYQGWFQVPVIYGWTDLIASGGVQPEAPLVSHDQREIGEFG